MAVYTYDEEADALYVLLVADAEAQVARTIELNERLHVDVDSEGRLTGVEILYPSDGDIDLQPVTARFGVELRLPFSFAA